MTHFETHRARSGRAVARGHLFVGATAPAASVRQTACRPMILCRAASASWPGPHPLKPDGVTTCAPDTPEAIEGSSSHLRAYDFWPMFGLPLNTIRSS
jgi:hypothetical protein